MIDEDIDINKIEEVNEDFRIITKNKSDILNEMEFASEDDKLLCESIIDSLENTIFESVRGGLTVSIPYIGNLRKNQVYEELNKKSKNFKAIRSYLSKSEYKQFVSDTIIDIKEEQIKKDKIKQVLTNIKRINKKKYEKYYIDFGRAYAQLFLIAIYWLKEIPFDSEVQYMYDKLRKENE